MNKQEYIEWLAPRVVIDSLARNLLPSFRIAQGCFEPAYGTSELAVNANNLFGVKNNDQWAGKCYDKDTKECYDGVTLEDVRAIFRAYDSWEESIADQGDYLINRCTTKKFHPELKHYAELVGNRDHKDCARILQEKHYGTSPDYDQRVIDYIKKHDLTKYDHMTLEEARAMIEREGNVTMSKKVFLSAGHGGSDPGAVGYGMKEKDINLQIMLSCQNELVRHGVTVICSRITDENDPVSQEVKEANASGADIAVSFHTNAGRGNGSESYAYPGRTGWKLAELCEKHTKAIGQNSRGVKSGKHLKFVRSTTMPAVLCECAFIDNDQDNDIIDTAEEQRAFGVAYAKAILEYLGIPYEGSAEEKPQPPSGGQSDAGFYRLQLDAFKNKANAEVLKKEVEAKGYHPIIVFY